MLKTAVLFYFALMWYGAFSDSHPIIAGLQAQLFYNTDWSIYRSTLQFKGYWGNFQQNGPISGFDAYGCGAQLLFDYTEEIKGLPNANCGAVGLRITFCSVINWKNQTIIQRHGNNLGKWKGMQMCPQGSYIMGFQVRFQDFQGAGDDTTLNGLKIFCRNPFNAWAGIVQAKEVMVYEGMWGDWKNIYQDKIGYLRYFQIQNQKYQKNADNTCMNGLQFLFQNFFKLNDSGAKFKEQCLSPMQRVSKV